MIPNPHTTAINGFKISFRFGDKNRDRHIPVEENSDYYTSLTKRTFHFSHSGVCGHLISLVLISFSLVKNGSERVFTCIDLEDILFCEGPVWIFVCFSFGLFDFLLMVCNSVYNLNRTPLLVIYV